MTEPVILAVLGLVGVLLNGVVVVAVAAWISTRKTRSEAKVKADEVSAQAKLVADGKREDELAIVRREYLARIERLEQRLEEKDRQIQKLQEEVETLLDERRDLKSTAREQARKIDELERQVASLRGGHS
jgi:peptidoglycan hydrolase CwlO-like protein